eukprot:5968538-Prorocentrum_lima.AAC.1
MTSSLVGSEMCIRDRPIVVVQHPVALAAVVDTCASKTVVEIPLLQDELHAVSYTHLRAHETRRHL